VQWKGYRFVDSSLFDAVTRRLAKGQSRRLTLQAGAAGLVALLADAALGSEAEGAGKSKKQKRNRRERKQRRRERKRQRQDRAAFQTCTAADGAVSFVGKAPGKPPRSKGAAMFKVGPDPAVNDWAHLRNADFAGLAISAIQKLEYSTYINPLVDATCPTFAPYMALYTVAGGTNHILVSVPERSPVACDTWQTIDAATQKWWVPTGGPVAPQNDPKTLAQIEAAIPGMTIRNAVTTDVQCPTALGGLRLEFGEFPGGGGTGDAVAYVSYLDVQIGNTKKTYLF
jgi:hypothetical protein